MFALQKLKRRSDSRGQIAIKQVRDGVLELPGKQYRVVLEVTPVNFELKSEEEQDAIIDTYESFLNSVGYQLQILIRTREIDMDKYLEGLSLQLQGETEEVYRNQLSNYDEFIRSLITTNKILTRQFYIIIPYSGIGGDGFGSRSNRKSDDFELVKEQLMLALDIVAKGVARLGMSARQLDSLEVLDLFYSFYSPEQSKIQPLTDQALRLVHDAFATQSARVDSDSRDRGGGGGDDSQRRPSTHEDNFILDDDGFKDLTEYEAVEKIISQYREGRK